jgi:glycosyltransferase involved in cell wall biosynthesis
MKKILYLSFNDPDASPGVLRKEREFCEVFGEFCSNNGMQFQGLCIAASLKENYDLARFGKYLSVKRIPSLPYRLFSRIPLFCSLFRIHPVYTQAYTDIGQFNPDVILWRFSITTVPGIFNPRKICPDVLFMSEHQAKELEELSMTLPGRILYPVMKRNARKVLENIDAVLGVTSEITGYELALAGRNVPSLTMTNSIDVEGCPKRNYRHSADIIRLLYVGSNTTDWHGLDRVLKGMADYQGNLKLELHIAGDAGYSIQKLVRTLKLTDHVVFHGYTTGKSLDSLFDISDLAIGTLGMHRKKLSQGSTLKVREYMARGIPFMISYEDEDLFPGLPYVFTAPPDESPIDMHAVIRFAYELYEISGNGLSGQMRAYALEHMDYRVKVRKLAAFLDSFSPLSKPPCVA